MIDRLNSEEQWAEAFPVMHELRKHLALDTFQAVKQMTDEGYQFLALYDGHEIAALAQELSSFQSDRPYLKIEVVEIEQNFAGSYLEGTGLFICRNRIAMLMLCHRGLGAIFQFLFGFSARSFGKAANAFPVFLHAETERQVKRNVLTTKTK